MIMIYRALPAFTREIRTGDYVTRSRRFAREHAATCAAYHEEPYQVVRAWVPADQVVEADNPGEFKWTGDPIHGRHTLTEIPCTSETCSD